MQAAGRNTQNGRGAARKQGSAPRTFDGHSCPGDTGGPRAPRDEFPAHAF